MRLTEQEFEIKYGLYKDTIYSIAYTYTHNSFDASDITQDVFMKYLNSTKSFSSNDDEKYWLIRVTINTSLSYVTSSWKKKVDLLDSLEHAKDEANSEEFNYYKEIVSLPNKSKEVLILYYYEDLKIEEIAKVLKTNPNVIKKRLQRAREKLKERLKED